MFHQQQKMQDAFYDQYEMDLAFQLMRGATEKDGSRTDAQMYIDEITNSLAAV